MFKDSLGKLTRGESLSDAEVTEFIENMRDDVVSEVQIAGFLVALLMKGPNVDEVASIVRAMRANCVQINPDVEGNLTDMCGTGGGLKTFNVSSANAIMTAAAGVPVAKHGSRSISASSGSADALEALGHQRRADAGAGREADRGDRDQLPLRAELPSADAEGLLPGARARDQDDLLHDHRPADQPGRRAAPPDGRLPAPPRRPRRRGGDAARHEARRRRARRRRPRRDLDHRPDEDRRDQGHADREVRDHARGLRLQAGDLRRHQGRRPGVQRAHDPRDLRGPRPGPAARLPACSTTASRSTSRAPPRARRREWRRRRRRSTPGARPRSWASSRSRRTTWQPFEPRRVDPAAAGGRTAPGPLRDQGAIPEGGRPPSGTRPRGAGADVRVAVRGGDLGRHRAPGLRRVGRPAAKRRRGGGRAGAAQGLRQRPRRARGDGRGGGGGDPAHRLA